MAKKNNTVFQNTWILFATATFLLAAGGLMKTFPVLIFVGFVPLFAISDLSKDKDSPWNHLELILLSLAVFLFCAQILNPSHVILVIIQAILLTFAFAGYAFLYQSLGSRLGKFTIIFFWLGLEYLMLKLPWRNDFFFLADALELRPLWWKWNANLGYLAITIWVLVVNLAFYLAILKTTSINWLLIASAILLIAGPVVYSVYFLEVPGINRGQMIALYNTGSTTFSENYQNRGELISRSAAWVSVLILLLAIVKYKIKKK